MTEYCDNKEKNIPCFLCGKSLWEHKNNTNCPTSTTDRGMQYHPVNNYRRALRTINASDGRKGYMVR